MDEKDPAIHTVACSAMDVNDRIRPFTYKAVPWRVIHKKQLYNLRAVIDFLVKKYPPREFEESCVILMHRNTPTWSRDIGT